MMACFSSFSSSSYLFFLPAAVAGAAPSSNRQHPPLAEDKCVGAWVHPCIVIPMHSTSSSRAEVLGDGIHSSTWCKVAIVMRRGLIFWGEISMLFGELYFKRLFSRHQGCWHCSRQRAQEVAEA